MSQLTAAVLLALLAGACFLGARATAGRGPEAGFLGIGLILVGALVLLVSAFLSVAALF